MSLAGPLTPEVTMISKHCLIRGNNTTQSIQCTKVFTTILLQDLKIFFFFFFDHWCAVWNQLWGVSKPTSSPFNTLFLLSRRSKRQDVGKPSLELGQWVPVFLNCGFLTFQPRPMGIHWGPQVQDMGICVWQPPFFTSTLFLCPSEMWNHWARLVFPELPIVRLPQVPTILVPPQT